MARISPSHHPRATGAFAFGLVWRVHTTRFGLVIYAAALLIAGCQAPGDRRPASRPSTMTSNSSTLPSVPMSMVVTVQRADRADHRDPQPAVDAMIRLVIFTITLPHESVSVNEEFWKRVDEQAVGTAVADRMRKNGIRCGTVPRSESLYFSSFFDHQPHALSLSHVEGFHSETVPVGTERQFDRQDLFFFNASDQLEGRTYDHATDRLMLSFDRAPRQLGAVRLTICPMVQCQKMQLGFSPLNQEFETPIKQEDHLYDLGLTADVPGDSFFVIGPGSEAAGSTSIGGTFLTLPDKTQRKEQVIVIVPTLVRLDGKPVTIRDLMFR